MVKNHKRIAKKPSSKTVPARRSKRNTKRKETPGGDHQRSVAQLRRERETLEQEIRQLEENIRAYETEYLSTTSYGNAVRGYSSLLASQLPHIPDRVHVNDGERLFSKTQN